MSTTTASSGMKRVAHKAAEIRRRYEGDADRPLPGYAGLMSGYTAVLGGLTAVGRLRGARLPRRWSLGDTILLGVSTFKASRLLAKDAVTSPLRAPFTRFEEPAGEDELNESVPGHGAAHAIGELISCPFCLNVWVGTGLAAGFVLAPRAARTAATVLTAVAGADILHLLYDAGKKLAER